MGGNGLQDGGWPDEFHVAFFSYRWRSGVSRSGSWVWVVAWAHGGDKMAKEEIWHERLGPI